MKFTEKEQAVIRCLFQAMKADEIAKELKISRRTAKNRIESIADKLFIDRKRFILSVRIVYLLYNRPPYDEFL